MKLRLISKRDEIYYLHKKSELGEKLYLETLHISQLNQQESQSTTLKSQASHKYFPTDAWSVWLLE